MDHKLIKEFLDKTERLGLLAEVNLEGTYADFSSSIMIAFAKTKGGDETSNFLIEIFLTPIACQLAAGPEVNEGTLDPLARSLFASCSRFFETSLAAYFSSSAGNRLAYPAIKGQYDAYLKELEQKEEERIRRQQEEQLRQREQARKQEEERVRLQQEEQLRQHEQAKRQEEEHRRLQQEQSEADRQERLAKRARELSRFVFLGVPSGILVAIPLFTPGLDYYQEWVPAENVTAFVLYGICALSVILSSIWLTMDQAMPDDDIKGMAGCLACIFLVYQTFSLWSGVPNHIRAALIVSSFVAPFIPFIRGALAFYCLGKITCFLSYYLCLFFSWMLWGALGIFGWVWSWTTRDMKTTDSEIQKPRLQLVKNAVKEESSEPSNLKTTAVDNQSSTINEPTKSSFIELVSTDGRKISAKILAMTTNSVVIHRENGDKFEIPFSSLSETSVNKILEWRTLKKSQSSDANEIQKGASMQVKADSILFQEVDQLTQWEKLKKGGDAKALSAYQEKLLSSRDAWQFTNSLRVRVLGHEAAKHQVHVEMTTPGRMLGTNWWLDDSALVQ